MMAQTQNSGAGNTCDLISFRIAEQDFCFDIISVREIRGWVPATIIPHAPPCVLGVINLRGAVVPIVNLATRLNLEVMAPTSRSVIIIAQVNGQIVGLLVDAVSDILSVSTDEIQPTPDVVTDDAQGFINGIITLDERMIRMIDLDGILPPRTTQSL